MKRFWTPLTLFLSTLPLFSGKSAAIATDPPRATTDEPIDPVVLRPLNLPGDNLFAAHRSHSSHASHRSSSGGGYAPPQQAPGASRRTPPPSGAPDGAASGLAPPGTAKPTDPGRAAPVSPTPRPQAAPTLSLAEKRRLQIMRVQIALTSLGLYEGTVDGVLGEETKTALTRFQVVKGLEANGLMTTETLNALAVPAVQ